MNRVAFEPILASTTWLILLAIALVALPWLVPISGRVITTRRRRTLQWLRTGSVLLILLAMLRPAWIRTESQPSTAALAILLDRSRSMTLPADPNRSRYEVENKLLQQLLAALQGLDESLEIRLLQFAEQTRELQLTPELLTELKAAPTGRETRIGPALYSAVRSAGGKPLAGVILLGDGVEVRSTGQADTGSADTAAETGEQDGARLLSSLDVPLFTVPIGPPGDLQQQLDIELDGLPEAYSLFAGNEAAIELIVRTRAMAGSPVNLQVELQNEEGGKPLELATRSVTPERNAEATSIRIPIVAPEPGRYYLTVQAEAQEGEALLTNNSQVAFVDVRQGGGRVLYLEGQPRPEQSFLLRTLRRFPDLQVTYRWLALDTPDQWPIDIRDSLRQDSNNAFDLVILGNIPAAALGTEQLKLIQQSISQGSSLLMLGGPQTFAAGGYAMTEFAETLPVKLDATLPDRTDAFTIVPTQVHPITQLAGDSTLPAQLAYWASLPQAVGSNRFADARVAPGIQVLLETPDQEPLLVVGEYGAGRVATFALDSTWRWWRRQQNEAHRRFWRQMMLWLLNRDNTEDRLIDIQLPRRRVAQDQPIEFQILQTGTTHLAADSLRMEVLKDGKVVSTLAADALQQLGKASASASLAGQVVDLEPGLYQLAATSRTDDKRLAAVSFQVISNDAELRQPFADHVYLSQIASLTASAGGAMYLPQDSDQLINEIKQLRRRSETAMARKYRLTDTPVTAWPLFIGITGLLGLEWYLRRRWGLA